MLTIQHCVDFLFTCVVLIHVKLFHYMNASSLSEITI